MEFYRLDYSLSIFIPEANLKQDPIDKADIVTKAEVDAPTENEPLLVQLLKQRKAGGGPSARSAASKPDISKPAPSRSPPPQNENRNFGSNHSLAKKSPPAEPKPDKSGSKYTNKQSEVNDFADDFDDIEEMLPDNNDDRQADDDADKMFSESGNAFTGSQSMGMDPSVNTLAMDEYDHVEEVMHLN